VAFSPAIAGMRTRHLEWGLQLAMAALPILSTPTFSTSAHIMWPLPS